MEVKLYNSLTNKIEIFKPIKENEVSIYVCGPTVYNFPHIGNIRPVVFFDTLRKYFESIGYKVTYVSNFTDVDDKIINRAIEENKKEKDITDFYIASYLDTLHKFNVKDATFNPRVTEYMSQIIDYIDDLVKKEAAYVNDNEVFFDVSKDTKYGELSKINIEELIAGARIEENSKKKNPLDFLLWKNTDKGIKWDSPWGKGRPGWHTECCVMIDAIFNGMIDIHGGGSDLKFPHHENEIAQSEMHNAHHLANYWIHNAMMNIDGNKMSKSLGNVILAKDAINEFGADTTRLLLLNASYRSIINFNDETLKNTQAILNKLSAVYKQSNLLLNELDEKIDGNSNKINKFYEFLADDMNIPNGITYLLDLIKESNMELRKKEKNVDLIKENFYSMSKISYILGLHFEPKELDNDDKNLYKEYLRAKENKDFDKSDQLRQILITKNIL